MVNVSVIIPCFNVENFVFHAVNSVLNQSLRNSEIIIVDDGSTDETLKLIQQLSEQSKRIKIITKSNGGLSTARNEGLLAATGEYIVFLDGDDWLRNDALEKLYKKAKDENLDVLIADTLFYYSDDHMDLIYKRPKHFETFGISSGIDCFIELKRNNCYAPMAVNQIYKREFLIKNNLNFYHGLLNEDELWTPQVLCKAQRVNCMEFPFYYYRQRNNSIMSSEISSRKIRDNLFIASELINLIKTNSNAELTGWIWVKAYELYFRAITVYRANREDIKSVKFFYYSAGRLLISRISSPQFDICLKYLSKSFSFDLSVLLLVFMRKIHRKISKLII
jgi:glycosyltransferase involved in cell wall biosynthesis